MWSVIKSLLSGAPDKSGEDKQRSSEATPIGIVALVAADRDRDLLTNVADRNQLDMRFAGSCGEAWAMASKLRVPVILCDRDLPAVEWRDIVRILGSALHRPAVILTSRVVDDFLWQEVIRYGGYGVLAKPFVEDDVVRSVRLAWSYWMSTIKVSTLPLKHYR